MTEDVDIDAAPVSETPNKGGRPRKLIADEATLKQVAGLGRLQATVRECAAFFKVSPVTFEAFLKQPGVREALEGGQGDGMLSLRRHQLRLAEKNAAMAIWLGKQLLGQKDTHRLEHSGRDGGAIPIEVRDLSDEELDARMRAALAPPSDVIDAEFE